MSNNWYEEAVFYQIYPMGFCGAPRENTEDAAWDSNGIDASGDSVVATSTASASSEGTSSASAAGATAPQAPILKVAEWIPHIKNTGANAIYFSPIFESDSHGYDTRDYRNIDKRLGNNESFATLSKKLHDEEIRVIIDGVFNHVGRGFWAFKDVQQNRENSPYRWWFNISFDGDSNYGDGFWYEGWEGHYDLVKLNLQNQEVVDYLLGCVEFWMDEFKIDGLRLDVAYMLDENFMRQLRAFCKSRNPEFFLLGEMIHGDYNRIMNDQMLDSVTNYECYKGLYSAFNSMNLFEIGHSLARQFGPEPWTLYKGRHLVNFADNHDVTRVASILNDKEQLPALYTVLFCMPGMPCLYYGSEWGAEGRKEDGDWALRPAFDKPQENELTAHIAQLSKARSQSKALRYGDFSNVNLQNKQWVLGRSFEGETVIAAVNAEDCNVQMDCHHAGPALDLLTGKEVELNGSIELPPYASRILQLL